MNEPCKKFVRSLVMISLTIYGLSGAIALHFQLVPANEKLMPGQILGFNIPGVLAGSDEVPLWGCDPDYDRDPDYDLYSVTGYPVPIHGDGTISLPSAGRILVQGKSVEEVRRLLTVTYKKILGREDLSVRVGVYPDEATRDRIRAGVILAMKKCVACSGFKKTMMDHKTDAIVSSALECGLLRNMPHFSCTHYAELPPERDGQSAFQFDDFGPHHATLRLIFRSDGEVILSGCPTQWCSHKLSNIFHGQSEQATEDLFAFTMNSIPTIKEMLVLYTDSLPHQDYSQLLKLWEHVQPNLIDVQTEAHAPHPWWRIW